ncbi:MAG: amino acid permease [Chlamydiota bacterium]
MRLKELFEEHGHLLGGSLLIAGTSIGAGMLALPVLTSLGGFFPSIVIYFICWIFMAATGLLLLEVVMWHGEGANVITMADQTLGKYFKAGAWVVYLFLYYSLNVAYLAEGGKLVGETILGLEASWLGPVLFVAFFGSLITIGTRTVDRTNIIMMSGLIVSYFIFVSLGARHIDYLNLKHVNWSQALIGVPIAVTSFGYQHIIPTITTYMRRDIKKVKIAILGGTAVPMIFYGVWQWLILGIVPPYKLHEAHGLGHSAIQPLKAVLQYEGVISIGLFFAFCALVSSFLGVSIGVRDFLADGLKIKKTSRGRVLLSLLIFIPPLLIALTFPNIFLQALSVGGGIGCILLLGLLPILMVWQGRYRQGRESVYRLAGGKLTLVVLIAFVVLELLTEVMGLIASV